MIKNIIPSVLVIVFFPIRIVVRNNNILAIPAMIKSKFI